MTAILRAASAAVLVLLTALLAGACSDSGASGDPRGHNEADVEFATGMIQHHAQALQMVDLTLGRELDPQTARLAEQIRAAQTPEIERMADWLQEWGEPVPETGRDHANAHADDHGGSGGDGEGRSDMPGMMSAEQMDRLESASGQEFRTTWLEMMIEHHQGAIDMAETEIAEGQNRKAIRLAEQIARTQQREIERMQQLLG